MTLLFLVVPLIAVMMAAMAVGVILSNRSLKGSCGGVAAIGPDGEPMTCGTCDCKVPGAEDGDGAGCAVPLES